MKTSVEIQNELDKLDREYHRKYSTAYSKYIERRQILTNELKVVTALENKDKERQNVK